MPTSSVIKCGCAAFDFTSDEFEPLNNLVQKNNEQLAAQLTRQNGSQQSEVTVADNAQQQTAEQQDLLQREGASLKQHLQESSGASQLAEALQQQLMQQTTVSAGE